MNSPSRALIEDDSLAVFGRVLRDYGFWDACRLHRNRYIDRRYQAYLTSNKGSLSAHVQCLVDLFVAARPVSTARIGFLPTDCRNGLFAEGILLADEEGTVRTPFRVGVLDDLLILSEDFSDPGRSVYFGEDSEFYANMLEICGGARCLDLCTGTGVQALVSLSRGAAYVDAVDINPRALHIADLNARLNGLRSRITLYEGDMFTPLSADQRYDRITCNPPLLPIPTEISYPLVGDGGTDGLAFIRTILSQLAERLADAGKCLLLGLSTVDGISDVERLCDEWCQPPFGYSLYLLARQEMQDYSRSVAATIQLLYPDENPIRVGRAMKKTYRELGKTDVVSYYLVVRRGEKGVPTGVYDLTRGNYSQSYWFVGGR
jgi:2-polyprenyl-3-methyl-5-hydroxy-6-metoxy-1,4-benzoquinol methylase